MCAAKIRSTTKLWLRALMANPVMGDSAPSLRQRGQQFVVRPGFVSEQVLQCVVHVVVS